MGRPCPVGVAAPEPELHAVATSPTSVVATASVRLTATRPSLRALEAAPSNPVTAMTSGSMRQQLITEYLAQDERARVGTDRMKKNPFIERRCSQACTRPPGQSPLSAGASEGEQGLDGSAFVMP